ncbi:MAG: pyridoxal phosphate-dependent aminotransferase [Nitrospiraceae bacterium]|nr:MAG: pyridoxal phosphate-dependent aminotransferase [Nitrospiraceae bacterium]
MFSQKIVDNLNKSSWIRAMFEEGEKLRKLHGPDKVFDFSIGNPEIEPLQAVEDVLKKLVQEDNPAKHRYMSNAGYDDVREKVAAHLSKEHGVPVQPQNIVMTCGAAAGLNVVLKALLNPGEEVIVFSPFFVEYLTYIDNHGGKPVTVPTVPSVFEPDPEVLKNYISSKTKAVIINSPNNPTGVIYSEQALKGIAAALEAKEKEYGTAIFVISDEPYTKVVYDNAVVPSVLNIFKNSIIVNSFSKSLALPGERIGYIAANTSIKDVDVLSSGLVYCNRTLGYVNAPALFQKVIAETLEESIDAEWYKIRRDMLYNHLVSLGFTCLKPQGAFYLFPKALIEDDVEFVKRAVKYNLLLVPGKGFGCPGYFRLAYCMSLKTIEGSLPAFEALAKELR